MIQTTGYRRTALALGLGTLFLFAAQWVPWVATWESWTVDVRYRLFNRPVQASESVVVIDIDDASVKSLETFYGRWPFPRRIYKDLLEFVALGNPKAVLFDILFTGADKSGADDAWLAQTSKELGVVSHAVHLLEHPTEEGIQAREAPAVWSGSAVALNTTPSAVESLRTQYRDFAEPSAPLLKHSPALHVVTFPTDRDGVLRRAPLVFAYPFTADGNVQAAEAQINQRLALPSLALRGLLENLKGACSDRKSDCENKPTLTLSPSKLRIAQANGSSIEVPLDGRGYLPIHYYSLGQQPRTYSLAHILANARMVQSGDENQMSRLSVPPDVFAGKTIIVGTSAAALHDLKTTPIHPVYPGSMVQATLLSNLLTRDFVHVPQPWLQTLVSTILFVATYLSLTLSTTLTMKAAGALFSFVFYSAFSIAAFRYFNTVLPWLLPAVGMAAAVVDGLLFSYLVERRQKRKAQATLSKYLAPAVAHELIVKGIDPQAEVGRQVELTVLFSDIRGFTSISEQHPPEIVVKQLNEYLGSMTDTVFDHRGTLDKFIGDAVMAFWGAPLTNSDHAVHAVRCALEMRKVLGQLQLGWKAAGRTLVFENGIGINTGPCIVGNIGSNKKLDYTVIGDNVNLASRIEGLTKEYGVPVLVGENTYTQIQHLIGCRIADRVRVKGKERYVTIYQPVAEKGSPEWERLAKLVQHYDEAWAAIDAELPKEAMRLFRELGKAGDALSELHCKRLEQRLVKTGLMGGDKQSA